MKKRNTEIHLKKQVDEFGNPIFEVFNIDLNQPIDQYLLKPDVNFHNLADRQLMINLLQRKKKGLLEINFIRKALESTEFFSKGEHKNMLKGVPPKILAQCLKLKFVKKRYVIFNQGEIGDTYYIILDGEVYTLIRKPQIELQKQIEATKNQKKIIKQNNNYNSLDLKKEQLRQKLLSTKFFERVKVYFQQEGGKIKTQFSSLLRKTALGIKNL
ncbi:Cyclic nucleotide-binding protein [Pseudocohnilembus persalinus]|uniref:Cyclic nucleotide-binding protein n=1 Tax=Pseudocohnilembus persalinus TaxID=266149 RepID=A0A0V0QZV9_PSEPJ|nr:Cyclic nucleotide-binding protein [Pseudocohnilembus persalinus]|eukprot:KRX07761.1 Cyclic nucleotide-binding protein [Pseudocohnilembus persalinus]